MSEWRVERVALLSGPSLQHALSSASVADLSHASHLGECRSPISPPSLHFRRSLDVISVFTGAYSRLPQFGLVPPSPFPSPSLSPASALASPQLRDWSGLHLPSKASEEAGRSEREWLERQRDLRERER